MGEPEMCEHCRAEEHGGRTHGYCRRYYCDCRERRAIYHAGAAAEREAWLAVMPRCEYPGCDEVATREDCNLNVGCDDDEHICHEDGGPRDLKWSDLVRGAIEAR